MSTVELNNFVTAPIREAAGSDFDPSSVAVSELRVEEENRRAWDELIDRKLIEWGRHQQQLADEGVEPPRGEVVRVAIELANRMKIRGFAPPSSVVPDPNGGIVFERREGTVSEVFHIWDDGSVEYQRFEENRLVERRFL